MTIEEQKRILSDRLKMVSMCSSEDHKNLIQTFKQTKHRNDIERYLKTKAWQDDKDRNTKVFLIKDIEKNEIAYYFSINCGILYREIEVKRFDKNEEQLYQQYLNATIKAHRRGLSREQQDEANAELTEAYEAFYKSSMNPDRITELISSAEEKAKDKKERRELFENTNEEELTMRVKETFPAIDIKFFGRNNDYDPGIKTDFRLGVFVFWEIIVPHLLDISNMVGCKYIYLFAADMSNNESDYMPPFYDQNYDPYEDNNEATKKRKVLKLVEYYQNELKFRPVNNYKVLKPDYERSCYTLIQEVDDLQANREEVWQSHMPENYSEYDG